MKLLPICAAAALAAGFAFPASAARAGSVSYSCDNGQRADVRYRFDRNGKAVSAEVKAGGIRATLPLNARRSDSTGTTFSARGYTLSGGYIDAHNYSTTELVGLTAHNRFVVKNCQPHTADARSEERADNGRHPAAAGRVAYQCQNNRRLNVQYSFNRQGVPTRAVADIEGHRRTLAYDLNRSDNVDTVFTGSGYTLSAGQMDAQNYRSQNGIMVTAPSNRIAYKDCSPR
ncbi:hypothetical protein A7P95_03915 [Eikenella longinqua]|uniref:ACP-like domain-containing protein n=1 Tax=Eikenella longinqua TaxID=1795827 RepID=A0A1A9RYT3_9NEIS|nr:hypothetical protein [Eikenella longinqua]OAM29365.1 hypothetical protein A7P95_03915 [Eikenella longinqua]